jgi:hypothetical protein
MADMKRDAGLRTIFSFFLGLMLTAFVGVGVYTFHRPPEQFDSQIQSLARRDAAIRSSRPSSELTTAELDQIQEINRQRRELLDAAAEARKPWGRSTSMILIVFATLAMAVSLVRADQLPVISNGLLLGGLFTMLYGVGWIVATDTSIVRFLVMTAGTRDHVGARLCPIRAPWRDLPSRCRLGNPGERGACASRAPRPRSRRADERRRARARTQPR